jgi:hypothetical protein
MPRIARAVVAGLPHYITQHGNYRQVVFGCEPWKSVVFYD